MSVSRSRRREEARMRDLLGDQEIDGFCAARGRWERLGQHLVGEATAVSFAAAIAWVIRIAEAAEYLDHHPDIDIRWRTLTFRLTTHSAGALTELDLRLAERIDAIVDATNSGEGNEAAG
jgi:4a-hydroxytetrahydrobiopterin dehydratase